MIIIIIVIVIINSNTKILTRIVNSESCCPRPPTEATDHRLPNGVRSGQTVFVCRSVINSHNNAIIVP